MPRKQLINFEPGEDRVVVESMELKNKTDKGIFIPDSAERPLKGKIVAAANATADHIQYEPGMIVSYGKYAGTEILIEDKEYLIMRSGDIFGQHLFPNASTE
jgi:chaperonin GroES